MNNEHIKKNILWFVRDFEVAGGGERYILEAARVLRRKGINVIVVCVNYHDRVLCESYTIDVKKVSVNNPNKFFAGISIIKEIRRYVREYKPEVLMAQTMQGFVIAMFATILTKYKYSLIDFGDMYQRPNNNIIYSLIYSKKTNFIKKVFIDKCERFDVDFQRGLSGRLIGNMYSVMLYFAYKNAKNIYVLSQMVRLENIYLYKKNSILLRGAYREEIFNNTDRRDYKNITGKNKKYVYLSLNRLVKHKRTDLIVDAYNEYIKEYKDYDSSLVIAGTGPEQECLQKKIDEYGLGKYVRLLGFVDEREINKLYESIDVFVSMDPADYDITVYMALALRKKVIVPKIMCFDDDIIEMGLVYSVCPKIKEVACAFYNTKNEEINISEKKHKQIMKKYAWENCFDYLF